MSFLRTLLIGWPSLHDVLWFAGLWTALSLVFLAGWIARDVVVRDKDSRSVDEFSEQRQALSVINGFATTTNHWVQP